MTEIDQTPAGSTLASSGWNVHAPAGRVHPPIEESEALVEPFLSRCKAQEDMYVAAGFPLDGITDFWRKWFAAWNEESPEALRDCWAEDLVWTISSTGQLEYYGRENTLDLARFGYMFARQMKFYPWDGTDTNLPYYDFLDGQVRAAFPYSGGTGFFWQRLLPWPHKSVRGCGVDRYLLRKIEGDWRITRIDTDQDVLVPLLQMLPFADAIVRLGAWAIRTLPRWGRRLGLYDRSFPYSRQFVEARIAHSIQID
ncbi:nuclear transport factor 2 family protein [Arthrobacter sp. SLBN-53]|uniref:nuclear transport factor 2 family protein n=1 Tax=Arthrobacter sp. SLBN-53 TaxID=2768412 RepID=UPI00114F1CAB|nr:nuclear transport factor 2 family protein [Arthrobacter sp. SLBN-53]TQK32068.1 SnoaL-like protein [Arthrobacter sp. SLBN-53]